MAFEVEINGTLRRVSIEALGSAGPDGGRFRVVIDQKPIDVDARPTDLGLSLIVGDARRSVDVAVTERAAGEKFVQLPHVDVVATVDGRRFRRGRGEGVAADGEQRITAPMPGRVVRILVKAGDEVAAKQPLVVVEAMKMENELASPKAGTIKEVVVAEGASVEAGRLLVVVQ